jgi:hypothetical protein
MKRWKIRRSLPAKAPPSPPPAGGISMLITLAQRARLAERGFTPEQIRDMTPEEAHRRLGLIA